MDLDGIQVEQLSEGFFELFEDGSFKKMAPSRLNNLSDDPNLGTVTSAIGIDPLLIQTPHHNIIVDPGLGWGLDAGSNFKDTSNIRTNLDIFDLKPEDIDYVILSHLHFDHVAGASYVSEEIETRATFPNAQYRVHRDEWEYALSTIEKSQELKGAGYNLDELYKLVSEDRIYFQEQDEEKIAGCVRSIRTGGHTPGHMIIKIEGIRKSCYYLGDLVPTEYHLNHYSMRQLDTDPVEAKKAKALLLREALREKAILVFYHSLFQKSGQISRDPQKKYVLIDI